MKFKYVLILIIFALTINLSGQNILKIAGSGDKSIDQIVITLDKTFTGQKRVKISSNIIELPISSGEKKFPGEVGNARLFFEGNWLKIMYPGSYLVGFLPKAKQITVRSIDGGKTKEDIRKLIEAKKYKESISLVRKIIEVNDSDGETWYLGGVIREKMGEKYKAKINYNKAKKYGYDPNQKKAPAVQPVEEVKKELSAEENKEAVIPPDQKGETGFNIFIWPLIIIGIAILVLLYFLFGQNKKIKVEDEDYPENFNAAMKKAADIEPRKKEEPLIKDVPPAEKKSEAIDFSMIDRMQQNDDPDATIVFDGDLANLDPDALSPEVDFDKDYPVFKSQREETFGIEEEEILDSVVNDIQRKAEPRKRPTPEDTRKLALQIARQRLMEMGSEKCRIILFLIGKGNSFAEIANQNDVSISDVELVNKYLKIGNR